MSSIAKSLFTVTIKKSELPQRYEEFIKLIEKLMAKKFYPQFEKIEIIDDNSDQINVQEDSYNYIVSIAPDNVTIIVKEHLSGLSNFSYHSNFSNISVEESNYIFESKVINKSQLSSSDSLNEILELVQRVLKKEVFTYQAEPAYEKYKSNATFVSLLELLEKKHINESKQESELEWYKAQFSLISNQVQEQKNIATQARQKLASLEEIITIEQNEKMKLEQRVLKLQEEVLDCNKLLMKYQSQENQVIVLTSNLSLCKVELENIKSMLSNEKLLNKKLEVELSNFNTKLNNETAKLTKITESEASKEVIISELLKNEKFHVNEKNQLKNKIAELTSLINSPNKKLFNISSASCISFSLFGKEKGVKESYNANCQKEKYSREITAPSIDELLGMDNLSMSKSFSETHTSKNNYLYNLNRSDVPNYQPYQMQGVNNHQFNQQYNQPINPQYNQQCYQLNQSCQIFQPNSQIDKRLNNVINFQETSCRRCNDWTMKFNSISRELSMRNDEVKQIKVSLKEKEEALNGYTINLLLFKDSIGYLIENLRTINAVYEENVCLKYPDYVQNKKYIFDSLNFKQVHSDQISVNILQVCKEEYIFFFFVNITRIITALIKKESWIPAIVQSMNEVLSKKLNVIESFLKNVETNFLK